MVVHVVVVVMMMKEPIVVVVHSGRGDNNMWYWWWVWRIVRTPPPTLTTSHNNHTLVVTKIVTTVSYPMEEHIGLVLILRFVPPFFPWFLSPHLLLMVKIWILGMVGVGGGRFGWWLCAETLTMSYRYCELSPRRTGLQNNQGMFWCGSWRQWSTGSR